MELYLVEYDRESLHEYECNEQFVIAVCDSIEKANEFKEKFQDQWGKGVRVRKIQLNEFVN